MDDWQLDMINETCAKELGDRFECVLREGKGRVLISKVSISEGELLFSEPILHYVYEEPRNAAYQVLQKMCVDPEVFYEPLWYWAALCSLTASQLQKQPRCGRLKPVTPEQQKKILCLFHEPVEEVSDAVEQIVAALELNVAPIVVEELLQAWILNCFEHSSHPVGISAYFVSSFMSHSCGPSVSWLKGPQGAHVLKARRDIAPGDEATISYLEESALLHSAEARKKSLQETKLFECSCERCSGEGGDPARGFQCPGCRQCGIFYSLRCKPGEGLRGIPCVECGRRPTKAEIQHFLRAEKSLETRLDELDAGGGDEALDKAGAQALLKSIDGVLGPQHWLVDRATEHLGNWFVTECNEAESRRMMQMRARYRKKAFPNPGTCA